MSPSSLKAEARRAILRGVRKMLAIEQASFDDDTPPEILDARDLISASWSYEERELRWLIAHSGRAGYAIHPDVKIERDREYHRAYSQKHYRRRSVGGQLARNAAVLNGTAKKRRVRRKFTEQMFAG